MDAVTRVPVPYNEPVRQYQPGSADRAALAAKIKELSGQFLDLGAQRSAVGAARLVLPDRLVDWRGYPRHGVHARHLSFTGEPNAS